MERDRGQDTLDQFIEMYPDVSQNTIERIWDTARDFGYTAGFKDGRESGYVAGHESGYDEGYDTAREIYL